METVALVSSYDKEDMASAKVLHSCTILTHRIITNRLHILFHFTVTLLLLYYRISHFFNGNSLPALSWALITISEIIFTFIWCLTQAFRWRPLSRTVSIDEIPANMNLEGLDVFVCTADPRKEPTMEVMNTIISALALDYPPEKLAVYLSDDGGSYITLYALKEAFAFSKRWLPFCMKYRIKTRCPEAFFSLAKYEELSITDEFSAKKDELEVNASNYVVFDRPAHAEVCNRYIQFGFHICLISRSSLRASVKLLMFLIMAILLQIIHGDTYMDDNENDEESTKMPLLVYVSRERRPSKPHRFKAGALNALLRVSEKFSNGPYLLVLDCDMYCNDPTSARQAMCFHLDPQMSPSLAFVQFPQMFYNISKNDIYDNQARSAYRIKWQGMDGIRGPSLSGTSFYLKRKALYGSPNCEDKHPSEAQRTSGELMKFSSEEEIAILKEAKLLASCNYERNTKWGEEASYLLHCRGWTSVYLCPTRPCFLGCTTIDMKDALVQLVKWSSGLLQIGLSRFSPLSYGVSRMSILQSMCYGYFIYQPLYAIAFLIYGIIPQLCFLNGIPLYPKVLSPWFVVFSTVYLSAIGQQLHEVLSDGGTTLTWWNEQRIWVIKSVSGSCFGCLDVFMKWSGIEKTTFRLTNKAVDKDKLEKYEKGEFDFQGATMFMIPLSALAILNMACFIGGLGGIILRRNYEEMFGQIFLSLFIMALSYPMIQGLLKRSKKEKQ
ncbi:hypothetical protein Gorai_006144 [Gossypium raimondii]|uniref:Glycosyltransferase 2-like domain-containing protein n=1 Tax=Gossypium raimondii TaxID=29730 RepID=A0A7J8QEF4_GOSRA|nr:hypothetical protein [Gossypium raimondii]